MDGCIMYDIRPSTRSIHGIVLLSTRVTRIRKRKSFHKNCINIQVRLAGGRYLLQVQDRRMTKKN